MSCEYVLRSTVRGYGRLTDRFFSVWVLWPVQSADHIFFTIDVVSPSKDGGIFFLDVVMTRCLVVFDMNDNSFKFVKSLDRYPSILDVFDDKSGGFIKFGLDEESFKSFASYKFTNEDVLNSLKGCIANV